MKKAASWPVQLLNFTPNPSSSQLPLFSVHIQHCHSHQTVPRTPLNGVISHQWLAHQLRQCPKLQSLAAAKSLHALAITMGSSYPQPMFLSNIIISSYASWGELFLARNVFDRMPQRNVVSFNTIIGAYSRHGNAEEAWKLFVEMRGCGFEPTQYTFGGLLSCPSLDLARGFNLQALIIKSGWLYSDAFAGTALLGFFRMHWRLDEAIRASEDMPLKNLATWNSMISLFGQHGFVQESIFMFRELMRVEGALSEYSYVGVLSGFESDQDLESGEQLHGLLIKNGLGCNILVANALISMYVSCSGPYTAEKMFWEVTVRDIATWNTTIGALATNDMPAQALELFLKMHVDELFPNQTTLVHVIHSFSSSWTLMYGKYIHAKVIKYNLESDVFVGSALVDLYVKDDELEDAHCCFDDIDEKNVVSWNSLILGYSKKCCLSTVSQLREMIQLDYCPNEYTFSTVLKSSFILELQQVHSLVIKMGYDQNEYVSCSLITSYAKNGLISDALVLLPTTNSSLPVVPCNVIAGIYNRTGQYHKAQELFSVLQNPDLVSWNILLAACSRNGDYKEVFELFGHMQMGFVHPDKYTYVSLLCACTNLCNLALGSSLHGLLIKTDFDRCDTFVHNVMIDMYGKCGSLESSLKIFNQTGDKNLITWTALISALGLHGHAVEALRRFEEMEAVGFKPDEVAFVAVLSACRHGGLVNEGNKIFGQMRSKYGIEPEMDHYLLMVDLLTRCGRLKEAEQLIISMPFPPNALIWRCFLEGCKKRQSSENIAVQDVDLEYFG